MTTDSELIDQILGGKLEAFDELMRRYERLVFKVAYGFTGSRESALDVSQTVFMNAYRARATFRKEANVKTWLMRIAFNEAANWKRSYARRAGETLEGLDEELVSEPSQMRELEEQERKHLIDAALGELNERHRLAVVLRYMQGMPIGEISEILQCTEGVTKNILFRSVRRMRDTLAGTAGVSHA
ncbi:MAG: RNA polymerase sigma factor [Thermoanaerobaculia bacterium]